MKHFYLFSLIFLFACKKEYDPVADSSEIGVILDKDDKPPIDSINQRIKYSDAGVFYIKREYNDSSYIKRACTMVPSIEVGNRGELYCAWYNNKSTSSAQGEGFGAYISVAVSIDGGSNWIENELIVAPIDSLDRIFDMSLWKDPSGTVHMFWSRSVKSVWDGKGAVWECTLRYNSSGSYMETSAPKLFMSSGVMLNKPIVISQKEMVLYPQYIINTQPSINMGLSGIYVYSSPYKPQDKFLKVPTETKKIPFLPNTLISAYFEPQLLEQDKDTIICFIRTESGGIHYAKATLSSNLTNWSAFQKLNSLGDNPGMRFSVQRLASGNILFITCNEKVRKNMMAYLSTDNGKTFPYRTMLDNRHSVSYPDFTQDSQGNINIVWDRGRTSIDKEILFTKINEDDIIQKRAVKLKKVNYY